MGSSIIRRDKGSSCLLVILRNNVDRPWKWGTATNGPLFWAREIFSPTFVWTFATNTAVLLFLVYLKLASELVKHCEKANGPP